MQIEASPSSCSLQRVQSKGLFGTVSPFSATPQRGGKSHICTANLSPREPVFESFDSLRHHGRDFCREKQNKTHKYIDIKKLKAAVTKQTRGRCDHPFPGHALSRAHSALCAARTRSLNLSLCRSQGNCTTIPFQQDRYRKGKAELLPRC